MSLVLNVEILGEFKKLTQATKGAESQLSRMNKTAGRISKGMIAALGAIGVGFSLSAITRQLEESAKAAIDDQKSMNLLALAMKNAANATDDQVAAAEKSIRKMQFQAGVADDELRPAFQKLFVATKDVEQSNRLLQIALDASAATGKSLDAVSQAMAKSLAGSDTALVRLIPSLKGAKDPMAELERTFKGAAAEAANTDPYQRMQIIFGEMQETIGMALLPSLNKFSQWLATPEGQEKLQGLLDLIVGLVGKFGVMLEFVIDNKEAILGLAGVIGTLGVALKAYNAIQNTTIAGLGNLKTAAGATLGVLSAIIVAYQTIAPLADAIAKGGGTGGSGSPAVDFSGQSTAPTPSGVVGNMVLGTPKATSKAKAVTAPKTSTTTVNVNVKNVTDAKSIIKTVSAFEKSSGATLAKALR